MRTIIAGSRHIADIKELLRVIEEIDWEITTVLNGTARGADILGEIWARKNHIAIERYPAEWKKYGKGAGYIRNGEMANNADALIALWDGYSNGTRSMISIAENKGLKVYVHNLG